MTRTEGQTEACDFQETLDQLPQYSFYNGTTIYWDGGFGRCETEGQLTAEQLKTSKWRLHYYRALNDVTVYCWNIVKGNKRITLYKGQLFRAGGGVMIK